jgi:hypothetical protein
MSNKLTIGKKANALQKQKILRLTVLSHEVFNKSTISEATIHHINKLSPINLDNKNNFILNIQNINSDSNKELQLFTTDNMFRNSKNIDVIN